MFTVNRIDSHTIVCSDKKGQFLLTLFHGPENTALYVEKSRR